MLEGQRAANLFSTLAYDDENGLFLCEDPALGFGFICSPLSGSDEATSDRLNVFLSQAFPVDTLITFNLWTSPDLESTWAKWSMRRTKAALTSTHAFTEATLDFLKAGTVKPIEGLQGQIIRRTEVLISVKLPIKEAQPSAKELKASQRLRLSTLQSLVTIGLHPITMTRHHYLRRLSVMLNWAETSSWRESLTSTPDDGLLLRDQLLDYNTRISIDDQGVSMGPKRVSTLSVKRYPDHLNFGSALSYLGDLATGARGLREHALITLTLHYPDAETTKAKLDTVRQWVTTQAHGPILKFVPHLGIRKAAFDDLYQSFLEGDRPIKAYFGLCLFTDPEFATEAVSNAKVYFRELGFQMMEDRFLTLPIFLNALPLGAERTFIQASHRYRTFGTRHVIPIIPLFADWAGTQSQSLSLISRSGELMGFSLFDSGTNYNACIAAQSGSGKSFLTNELVVNALAEGARVWVIDVGRSYMNLAEALGGEFMSFSPESRISLNPFNLIKNWNDEADVLAGLVASMAAPNETLSDFQTASLKRILRSVYEQNGSEMTVDDLAQALLDASDRRIQDLGEQLYAFTRLGEYGRYFNGKNTVCFNNDFTVLELEELKGRKHLQQVVLLQLIYQIQQAMYLGERDRPKIVIIDEAWDLLTLGDAATFMEHGYRRFRKYGGSAITITQSVNDLYRTTTGRAIVENSAHMLLLGQKSESIEALRTEKKLSLSDAGYQLLKTVHTEPGLYSEIFLLTERGSGIGRLVVDPFKRLLYSTKPNDVQAIRTLRQQGMSLIDAIQHLIRNHERTHA